MRFRMKHQIGCALLAIGVAGLMLAGTPSLGAVTSGQEEAIAAFRIVSPEWVAQHSMDENVRILDVRPDVAEYQFGHVPGAVHLANGAMRGPRGGLPVQYLDPPAMSAIFDRAGVDSDDLVVVYADGGDVLGATMVAYCLQRIGHNRTAIMDGGFQAYRQSFPLTQEYPDVRPASMRPYRDASVYVTFDQLRELIGQEGVTILDTRPATDYLGNTNRWMRNGHIPGAVNLDWHMLMKPDNVHAFKPVEEMRRLIESTGVKKQDDVVVYCGTSREATLVYQVMKHVLAYPNVRLYEGSWTEYCSKMDMPVERMPAKGHAMSMMQTGRHPSLEPYQCGDVTRVHTFGQLFLASQPSPADFELARKNGIQTVINMRHPDEVDEFNEEQVVNELGMAYYNPAWNGPDELTDHVIDRVRELLRTSEKPLLLHCSSANRVGAVWIPYRVLDMGASWEQAVKEAEAIGLKTPAYLDKARSYIERKRSN